MEGACGGGGHVGGSIFIGVGDGDDEVEDGGRGLLEAGLRLGRIANQLV